MPATEERAAARPLSTMSSSCNWKSRICRRYCVAKPGYIEALNPSAVRYQLLQKLLVVVALNVGPDVELALLRRAMA